MGLFDIFKKKNNEKLNDNNLNQKIIPEPIEIIKSYNCARVYTGQIRECGQWGDDNVTDIGYSIISGKVYIKKLKPIYINHNFFKCYVLYPITNVAIIQINSEGYEKIKLIKAKGKRSIMYKQII